MRLWNYKRSSIKRMIKAWRWRVIKTGNYKKKKKKLEEECWQNVGLKEINASERKYCSFCICMPRFSWTWNYSPIWILWWWIYDHHHMLLWLTYKTLNYFISLSLFSLHLLATVKSAGFFFFLSQRIGSIYVRDEEMDYSIN